MHIKEYMPMQTLRMLSTALLINSQDELMMMERSKTRTLSPGLWGAVGGHIEPSELNHPRSACLREITEETGIMPGDIMGLHMRYILIRLNKNEIRQQFFYVGKTDKSPSVLTDEGELHWIPKAEVFDRPIPFIFRCLLEHYYAHEHSTHPWVGTAGFHLENGEPSVHWIPLLDPEMI
jgi:8-oxo-dGTP diphosphatase